MWTTTSAIAGTAPRTRSSIALAWPCASASEPSRPSAERQEHDDPVVGEHDANLARLGAGLLSHGGLDRRGVDVDLLCRSGLANRLEVRLGGLDLGHLRTIAASTCSAISCAWTSDRSPGSLTWSETSMLPSTSSTVRLWISRTCETVERGGEDALANRGLPRLGLDVHDDVDPGQRVMERLLDAIGCRVPLTDRRAGRDADDDVRKVLAAGAPEPQPPELDGRLESRDRLHARCRVSSSGERSMSTSTFRRASRVAAATTSAETKSAAIESPAGKPTAAATRPASTAIVPAKSLPKWSALARSASLE